MRALKVAALIALSACACAAPAAPGTPVGAGEAACVGLWAQACDQVIAAVAPADGPDVAGFRIRCSVFACSDSSGTLEYDILWADGTRSSSGIGWGHGFDVGAIRPIPTPPVPPTCPGVPREQCEADWSTAMENIPEARISDVVAVLVTCTATCTPLVGSGTTTVVLRDGTRIAESSWQYDLGSP